VTERYKNYFLLNKQIILRHRKGILTAEALVKRARKDRTRKMCDLIGLRSKIKLIYNKFALLRFAILIRKKKLRTVVRFT